jgi:Zn-dependent protease with chaperone function
MGYLLPILLALGSLLLKEVDGLPLGSWPWAVPAVVPVPYLLAHLERRLALAGGFRRAAWCARALGLSPVLLQYLALGVFGWQHSLELWLDTELSVLAWPQFALLLVLAPYLLYTLVAIDAEAWHAGPGRRQRAHLRRFQTRMFLAGLGPIVGYILLASALARWEFLRLLVEEVTIWSLTFTLLLGLAFVFLLPRFLRATWETERLPPGPQREILEGVARLAGFRCRELLVWKTGDLMSNAAIVGLPASTRRVFFTDALLRQMGPRQLAAVFAHEIGHAKRHHVPLFIVWALAFFGALDTLLTWVELEGELLELAALAAALLLWMVAFGWISRRAELEADLYSLELLRDGIGITSALQSVAPASHSRTGWRHFSTRERIAFLERAAADPGVARRLRRQLRSVAALGLVLLLATGIWRLSSLVEDYGAQRTLVDLRLGHYAEARTRARSWAPREAQEQLAVLGSLVRLAGSAQLRDFSSRVAASERCADLARASLSARNLEAAVGWLRLGGLAGDLAAQRAAEVLEEARAETGPRALLEGDLGPWREALQSALADT